MSLSIPEPIPIEPLTQERPRGSPCGAQAYTTRLTAESFEAIKSALLVQERARSRERELSAKKGVPWATSKNEKHVVQVVVEENGETSMVVGDKTFPVQAIPEKKGPEIVARQTTLMHRDSDTGEMIPEHTSLHTVARVMGRFQVTRFLDDNNAAQVRDYTKNHEKERNSTIVLGNDVYMSQQRKRSTVNVEATSSTPAVQPAPISSSNAKSTKQSQVPTSSAAPYLSVPDTAVPAEFKSLGLTIPRTWERENISLPLRTIHVMVLNKRTEAEISAEIEKYTGQTPPSGELHEILTRIAIRDPSTGQWTLHAAAYLYVHPYDYPDYDRSDRPAAVKATRPKLRTLGYPDAGARFDVLRRSTVTASPSMAQSENSAGVTTAHRAVDLDALKREAEANLAPTLKSNVKPGFFSSSMDTKKKKTSKTKEPKEPKESKEPKDPKEPKRKKTKTIRDDPDMKPRPPRENEPSPAPAATSSKATPKLEPEPYIDPKAPVVRAPSRAGPGSAAGKLAAKKRLAEEAVMREKGILADSIQIPVLKATSPSKSAPATARSSPASAPLKPSLKRKSASDFSESPPKRRKAEMEEGEIDEAVLPAAGKGKAKAVQHDDEDDEYDKIVALSMKKRRSVSVDEKPPAAWENVKDAGVRTSSKTKKQVMDDEYEDVRSTRKKAAAASTSTTAKKRTAKEEDDEYGPKSASQRSVRWNTEVEEKSAAGIKKRRLAAVQEDDADYDDQRPKKKRKAAKAEPVEPSTSSRPKQRASKTDDEFDIKGRLERAKGTIPGAKRKADADPVVVTASPPLKLVKPDDVLSQKAAKQSLRVMKAESPRAQALKQSSTPAQPSGLRNLVASSAVEETKRMKKVKLEDRKSHTASPGSQPVRHPAARITNGKASASPAPISAMVQFSVDLKKSTPAPPDPAADLAATVMNAIDRRVRNGAEDLRSKLEELIDVDNALRTFLEIDQRQLKEKKHGSGHLKPGAASLFQKIKRMHELRHKLTMETQKVAHALQQSGNINDSNPVTTRQAVPRPEPPDDVISTRQRSLPVPEGITEEMEARHPEGKQRWFEAQAHRYSSQPTTPHRTPLPLPGSAPVRSPTLFPVAAPLPASIPGPSNYNPSANVNTSPPSHVPAVRVNVTPQESPIRSTPPVSTLPESKQSFQEVKTESKAFRRFLRKVPSSASATPGAPGTPTVAGLQSQQALTHGNSSPSGPGLPASAATPVTAATPIMNASTPLANAATPAATAPTPGVAPSPVIPTVAVFSPVA